MYDSKKRAGSICLLRRCASTKAEQGVLPNKAFCPTLQLTLQLFARLGSVTVLACCDMMQDARPAVLSAGNCNG
jgi:hypothetical protein